MNLVKDMYWRTPTGSVIFNISIKMHVLSEIVATKLYPFFLAQQWESSSTWLMEEKKNQMHCMVDWFMLKSAAYRSTLGLQIRLHCVTFPLFQNILCRCDWTDMCIKIYFSQNQGRLLQTLPLLDRINRGLGVDSNPHRLHWPLAGILEREKFWWVVLAHSPQLSPLKNAEYFTQVYFLYLFMYLSTEMLRLISVLQGNNFTGSIHTQS